MIKKIIFSVSLIVNVLLAFFCVTMIGEVAEKLSFEYVEGDTIRPDSLRKYLEWENYGVAASLSRPIRGGASVDEVDEDYYRLGEYTDILFLKNVFKKAGNTDTVDRCEKRLAKLREDMPEYSVVFDKMDKSVQAILME